MKVTFTVKAWDEYQYWFDKDQKVLKKINKLIKEIQRHPFEGTGKPEPLKHSKSGCWSRRITGEHRLVYRILSEDLIEIDQCKNHY